ncbi:MAG: S10 family peptidase [Gemmatimonadaceae bacterium]
MKTAAFLAGTVLIPAIALAQRGTPGNAGRSATAQGRADTTVQTTISRSSRPDTTPREVHVVTRHAATIAGKRVDYDATVGSIILRDSTDQPTGEIYYTAYSERGVTDASRRPVIFAYNGGPGSSSFWVHMGLLGPRRVDIPDTVHSAPPPYHLVDNQYSMLDKADLVFIDPIGTGYSKPLGKATGKNFWGVDQDANSLAEFVSRYLSESGRWNSPRYLMGESYGTTRSAALSAVLQDRYNIDLNGVILLSAVLDFQTITFDAGNDEPYIMYLPSYAAVAWYHHALSKRSANLRPFLQEAEHFATTDYAQALFAGDNLSRADRTRIIDSLQQYTGLSRDYIDKANLRITAGQFEKELLRKQGETVGRLDARFTGETGDLLAESADYDPQSVDVSSAYVSLFNQYMHEDLNYGKDKIYTASGRVNPWDWAHGSREGWPGHTNVAVDLARTLTRNPRLHVMLNSGLFDLATPYFAPEWTIDHLGVPKRVRGQITEAEYESGHMIYVHVPSLAQFKANVAAFIDNTSGVK